MRTLNISIMMYTLLYAGSKWKKRACHCLTHSRFTDSIIYVKFFSRVNCEGCPYCVFYWTFVFSNGFIGMQFHTSDFCQTVLVKVNMLKKKQLAQSAVIQDISTSRSQRTSVQWWPFVTTHLFVRWLATVDFSLNVSPDIGNHGGRWDK